MRRALIALGLLVLLWANSATAQATRLESLLENQLSADNRVVEIEGFSGVLTAEARLDRLTIADREGVWLVLENAVFNWNRAALFQGALEVRALTAQRLELRRKPFSEPSLPDAQASGFRIPDLPVRVQIDRFGVNEIVAGPGLIGTPFVARLSAQARLASGQMEVSLKAARLDGTAGDIDLDLAYAQNEGTLRLNTRIAEPQGGLMARALAIPDAPAVLFEMTGDGPLDAFAADIRLATGGTDRLAGQVTLDATGPSDARRFAANLSGDIRPMLAVDARAFFGPRTALTLSGQAKADGALTLDDLAFETDGLAVSGSGALDANRAPARLALQIAMGQNAARVTLPGTEFSLARADLSLAFDAAIGPDWQLRGTVQRLEADGISVGEATLEGRGQLRPDASLPFTGALRLEARQVTAPDDPALDAVIGPDLSLEARLSTSAEGEIRLDGLTLETPHVSASGAMRLTPDDGRMAIEAQVGADLPDLTPFSGLAALPLAGGLSATLSAAANLPGGAIDVSLEGRAQNLGIGQPRLAPLLAPQTDLGLRAHRDETGTVIEELTLANSEMDLRLVGSVDNGDGNLTFRAGLRDAGVIDARAAGPVDLTANMRDLQGRAQVEATLSAGVGLALNLSGALRGDAPALSFNGTLEDMTRFAAPLSGPARLRGVLDLTQEPVLDAELRAAPGVQLRVEGPVTGEAARLRFAADVSDLGAFVAPLPGRAAVSGTLDMSAPDPRIDADLSANPGISARISGVLTGAEAQLSVNGAIKDLGPFVPQLPGAARLDATVSDLSGDVTLDARLFASKGLSAQVTGQTLSNDAPLNLKAELETLAVFVPQMPGMAEINAQLRDLTGRQAIDATVLGPGLSARVNGALSEAVEVKARLERLERFADGLTGGADLTARASDLSQNPQVSARLQTDSGARADVSGQVGLPGNAVQLDSSGVLPLALAQPFAGNRALGGTARFDLRLNGPPALSTLAGTVNIEAARLFDPGLGLTVQNLSGPVRLAGGRAEINLSGEANEAPVTIAGSLGLDAPFPSDIQVTTTRLPYRLDGVLETFVSTDLRLSGTLGQRLTTRGRVALFDTEVRVPDTGLGGATAIPPITHQGAPAAVRQTQARAGLSLGAQNAAESGGGPALPLDIEIVAADPIFVRGLGLDAAFQGALRLTGTAEEPAPVGAFALERGRLDFLGRRLTLTEGTIRLTGTAVPTLDVVSETVIDDLTATVAVRGPADAPELQITSTPDRPEDEVLAQILFGRSFSTLSPFQIARLVASVRTLTGAGGPGFLERTRQVLSLDDLDVRTDETTGATELSFGQRITEDVYSEVEVDSQGAAQINLNLDVGRNTRLRGSVSNTGDAGIGIFWQKDY